MTELDEKLARYEHRIAERKPKEDEIARLTEEQRQEDLRQSYLIRTGRTSLTSERP